MDTCLTSNTKGLLFAGLTALTWSFLAIAIKVAAAYADATTTSCFRFLVAFALVGGYLAALDRGAVVRTIRGAGMSFWLLMAIAVGGLASNYVAYMQGVALTSPSNAQIIIQTGPLFLTLLAGWLDRERLTGLQWLGIALAVLGFAFFYRDQVAQNVTQNDVYLQGNAWILLGAFTWALFSMAQKRLVRRHPANVLNVFVYGLCAAVLAIHADWQVFHGMSWQRWLLFFYLGLNTAVAYGCLALALRHSETSKVSVMITLNPIGTILLMQLLNAIGPSWMEPEHIGTVGFLGAALVLCGAILVVTKRTENACHEPRS